MWAVALALLLGNWMISSSVSDTPAPDRVPYTLFRAEAQRGNVAEVTSQRDEIRGRFRAAVRASRGKAVTEFQTVPHRGHAAPTGRW